MNFSFRFQVDGMDVVETEFEMVSLAAATRNVIEFLLMSSAERPAAPEDAAGKSREETPKEGWRAETVFSTTEFVAATALGETVAALADAAGGANARLESLTLIPASASGTGR